MNIYVACSLHQRQKALATALKLSMNGHTVTSEWLLCEDDGWSDVNRRETFAIHWASTNTANLQASDVVLFLEAGDSSSGGTHVELGMALGLQKIVVVAEDLPNVFYYHPAVHYFSSVDEALVFIEKVEKHRLVEAHRNE